MNLVHAFWFLAGVGLGIMHAKSLWHSAKSPSEFSAFFGMLRLLVIAIGLLIAAILGRILPTATGWASAFSVTVAATYLLGPRSAPARSDSGTHNPMSVIRNSIRKEAS